MLDWVRSTTGARAARPLERVQSLWGGYGEILRVALDEGPWPTVIVKEVRPPSTSSRDAAERRSHERKLRSYQVEAAFYRGHAHRSRARLPRCIASEEGAGERRLLLEDLDGAGFLHRRRQLTDTELDACLRWLATFHASFMGHAPDDLWPVGTYWHLATRSDELDAMPDRRLAAAAPAIDRALSAARFQTLVHGDAKPANFCFGEGGVAAVDFQYVGGGCGVKDVVYLVSCLEEHRAPRAIERYFELLSAALGEGPIERDPIEAERNAVETARDAIETERDAIETERSAIEVEWRALLPLAWADLERFYSGWSPGHRPGPLGASMVRAALAIVGAPGS